MKKIILSLVFLFTISITQAQNSLFDNISTTDQYYRFFLVQDKDGDGIHEISDRDLIVKFNISRLPTGEGYGINSVIDQGNEKGKVLDGMDAVNGYATCKGYPYESIIRDRHSTDAYVAIGEYIFKLYNMSESGDSYEGISHVFIKVDKDKSETTDAGKKKKAKKKGSFMSKLKALKNASSGKASYGSAHKELQSQNLDKLITDYLVAMKAKQDNRPSEQKQKDKNIIAAKNRGEQDIKRYNDSIKVTPEYKDLQRRKRQNELNYQASKSKNTVTLRNNSELTIYVGKSGSRNPGTKISSGGTATWNCDTDAYLQNITKSGGSNAYSTTKTRVYSANSGCGKTININ